MISIALALPQVSLIHSSSFGKLLRVTTVHIIVLWVSRLLIEDEDLNYRFSINNLRIDYLPCVGIDEVEGHGSITPFA